MNENKKRGAIGGIIGFLVLMSIFTSIFDGSGFAVIPFVMIAGFIGLFGYIIRKANSSANRSNQDRNIFDEKEKEYEKQIQKHEKIVKNTKYKHTQSVKHDYSHRCPKCKTLISSKDKICPECGTVQKNTVRCKTCGHDNPTGNVVCENCNDFLY